MNLFLDLRTRAALRWLLRKAGGALQRVSRALGRAEASLATPRVLEHEQRRLIRLAMRDHDMVDDPDERYYLDRYWEWIEAELDEHAVDLSGEFLDAGCGSGRLTLPLAHKLAAHGGEVLGVDLLPESIRAAGNHAMAAGLTNVAFEQRDLVDFLADETPGRYTAILFLEVGYVLLDLRSHIEHLYRVLVPGGLLLASFRTQYYLALTGVMRRDWNLATSVLASRSGQLRAMGSQNWQTAGDATELLEASGFSDIALRGLGPSSGIGGDPLAAIARPSEMSTADLEGLAGIERELAASYPDVGRYLLASAVRPT